MRSNYRRWSNYEPISNYELPYNQRVKFFRDETPDYVGPNDQSPRKSGMYWFPDKATQIKWYTDPYFHAENKSNRINNMYTYERVSQDKIYEPVKNLRRASFIPYIRAPSGDRYWLLGSFHDFPYIKMDFGGKCVENRPFSCSLRELDEETYGVLVRPVITGLEQNRATVYKGRNERGDSVFFIFVDMTGHLKRLDEMQDKIISSTGDPKKEKVGYLDFYREQELLRGIDHRTGKPILTAFTLTDFLNNYRNFRARDKLQLFFVERN